MVNFYWIIFLSLSDASEFDLELKEPEHIWSLTWPFLDERVVW